MNCEIYKGFCQLGADKIHTAEVCHPAMFDYFSCGGGLICPTCETCDGRAYPIWYEMHKSHLVLFTKKNTKKKISEKIERERKMEAFDLRDESDFLIPVVPLKKKKIRKSLGLKAPISELSQIIYETVYNLPAVTKTSKQFVEKEQQENNRLADSTSNQLASEEQQEEMLKAVESIQTPLSKYRDIDLDNSQYGMSIEEGQLQSSDQDEGVTEDDIAKLKEDLFLTQWTVVEEESEKAKDVSIVNETTKVVKKTKSRCRRIQRNGGSDKSLDGIPDMSGIPKSRRFPDVFLPRRQIWRGALKRKADQIMAMSVAIDERKKLNQERMVKSTRPVNSNAAANTKLMEMVVKQQEDLKAALIQMGQQQEQILHLSTQLDLANKRITVLETEVTKKRSFQITEI